VYNKKFSILIQNATVEEVPYNHLLWIIDVLLSTHLQFPEIKPVEDKGGGKCRVEWLVQIGFFNNERVNVVEEIDKEK
jgi:hypothetical protein